MATYGGAPTIVTDGLVFAVDAANYKSYTSGSSTWVDLVGGNDGTFSATPTTSTSGGGSITFDGVDDKCEFPAAAFVAGDAATVSLWYHGNLPHINSFVIYIGQGSSRHLSVHLPYGNGTIYFDHMGTSGNSRLSSAGNNDSLGWHNWVFLTQNNVSPERQEIYRDGSLWASDSNAEPYSGTHDTFRVGLGTGGSYDNGTISSVKIYNRALSASEVLQNYNALKSRFGL